MTETINTVRAECPICGSIFKATSNYPADQKLYDHMQNGKAHRRRAREMVWSDNIWTIGRGEATCPICGKRFTRGYHHPADQKLYCHMQNGKAHKCLARQMNWNDNGWNWYNI